MGGVGALCRRTDLADHRPILNRGHLQVHPQCKAPLFDPNCRLIFDVSSGGRSAPLQAGCKADNPKGQSMMDPRAARGIGATHMRILGSGKRLLLRILLLDALGGAALVVLVVVLAPTFGRPTWGREQSRATTETPARSTEVPTGTRLAGKKPRATPDQDFSPTPSVTQGATAANSPEPSETLDPTAAPTPSPATPSSTPIPPTSTHTPKPSNTSIPPSNTSTATTTPTSTQAPTATYTATTTATSTQVPSATPTSTPTLDPCSVVSFTVIQIWPGNSNFYMYNSSMQLIDITAITYSWAAAGPLTRIEFNPQLLVTFSPADPGPIGITSDDFNQRAPMGFGTRALFFFFSGSGATAAHTLTVELEGVCTITHSQ